jgi:hypothetical protein
MVKRVFGLDGREHIEIGIGRIERVAVICLLWAFAAGMALLCGIVIVSAMKTGYSSFQSPGKTIVLICVASSLFTGSVAAAGFYHFGSAFRQKFVITSEFIEKVGPGSIVRYYWKDYEGDDSARGGRLSGRVFCDSPPVLRFRGGDLSLSYFGKLTPHGTEMSAIREAAKRYAVAFERQRQD